MKCKYCNVQIECPAKYCPLCHEKLDTPIESELFYPPKKAQKKEHKILKSVEVIYIFCWLVLSFFCAILNDLLTPTINWSLPLIALLGYGVFLIRNTLLSSISIGQKIFWQGAYIMFVLSVTQKSLTPNTPWVANYGLAFVCVFASLSVIIFMIIEKKYAKKYFLSAIAISLFGYLPIIFYWTKLVPEIWPCIVSLTVSSTIILFVLVFGSKFVTKEFIKKFHF